jgi:hypothetical protein
MDLRGQFPTMVIVLFDSVVTFLSSWPGPLQAQSARKPGLRNPKSKFRNPDAGRARFATRCQGTFRTGS